MSTATYILGNSTSLHALHFQLDIIFLVFHYEDHHIANVIILARITGTLRTIGPPPAEIPEESSDHPLRVVLIPSAIRTYAILCH